jgi:glycine/D-amino acid oxidase-like deaminating enzyme
MYVLGLARALTPGAIFETTRVLTVDDGEPCRVETDRGVVTARDVLVAASVPINNRVLLHTKIAAYRSYALALQTSQSERLAGLFWDPTTIRAPHPAEAERS